MKQEQFVEYITSKTKHGVQITKDRALQMYDVWMRQPCTLCDSLKVSIKALFNANPEHAVEYGGVHGLDRVILYSLCEPCFNDNQDADTLNEKLRLKIQQELGKLQ